MDAEFFNNALISVGDLIEDYTALDRGVNGGSGSESDGGYDGEAGYPSARPTIAADS